MRRWVLAILVAGAASLPASAFAGYGVLGTANGYGEFILNNSTRSSTDAQGKVAVGGNANFSGGLSVASEQAKGAGVNLVVGGNFSESNDSINGSVVVGGTTTYNNPTIYGNLNGNGTINLSGGGGTVTGIVTHGSTFIQGGATIGGSATGITALPIDFAAEKAFLLNLSAAQYKASDPSLVFAAPPGNYTNPYFNFAYNQIFLNATDADKHFYNITGAQLGSANSGLVINASKDATIVFNVSGNNITIPNTGFTLTGGIQMNHILFNFLDATSITLSGSAYGTYLAPKATITTTFGGFNGNLIANNLTGSIETHVYEYGDPNKPGTLFTGNLRSSAVPEPASLAMLVIGGLGLGMRMKKRKAIKA